MVIPPPLRPGARLHVVAPSSPFDVDAVRQGIEWLQGRYRVHHSPTLFERRHGFLAGTDEERLAELQQAMDADDVGAIVTARGGHGLTRLLDRLDWSTFVREPRWIVGFSDATALHCEAARHDIASLHGMNVAGLGAASPEERIRWAEALEAPRAQHCWDGMSTWVPGRAEGRLFGGNLTLLFTLAACGRLLVPEGSLLFFEDVSETSYRIDRMLTALRLGGHLRRAAGIVLGTFTDCSPGKFAVPVTDVLRDQLQGLSIPVVASLPVGHGRLNDPLPLGRSARLDAEESQGARLEVLAEP